MNCPKCGYKSLNQPNEVNRCRSCGEYWTRSQQKEIDRLLGLLREIEELLYCRQYYIPLPDQLSKKEMEWLREIVQGQLKIADIAKRAHG